MSRGARISAAKVMAKFESCMYTGPALEWLTSSSMFAPAEVTTNYVGLLGDASVRPCVTGRADGVKRMCSHERLNESGRKSRCTCD